MVKNFICFRMYIVTPMPLLHRITFASACVSFIENCLNLLNDRKSNGKMYCIDAKFIYSLHRWWDLPRMRDRDVVKASWKWEKNWEETRKIFYPDQKVKWNEMQCNGIGLCSTWAQCTNWNWCKIYIAVKIYTELCDINVHRAPSTLLLIKHLTLCFFSASYFSLKIASAARREWSSCLKYAYFHIYM